MPCLGNLVLDTKLIAHHVIAGLWCVKVCWITGGETLWVKTNKYLAKAGCNIFQVIRVVSPLF